MRPGLTDFMVLEEKKHSLGSNPKRIGKKHWEAQNFDYCNKGKVSPEDINVSSANH